MKSGSSFITITNFRFLIIAFLFSCSIPASAQPEVMAWGNITGIRVEGQLMEFESSLRVASRNWSRVTVTGRERQKPKYHRDGLVQIVNTEFGSIRFTETVKETGIGSTEVSVNAVCLRDTLLEGAFFCISLPSAIYENAVARINRSSKKQMLSEISDEKNTRYFNSVSSLKLESSQQQLEIEISSGTQVLFRKDGSGTFLVYFRISGPEMKKEQQAEKVFRMKSTGIIDKSPVAISVDAGNPGRLFAGFGGNFRLQSPKYDPPVINYCLDNMRVAWSRVELPWTGWQPEEDMDPVEAAKAGKLDRHVYESMEMAGKLTALGIPVIVSAWHAPRWSIVKNSRGKDMLNQEKKEKIYKSFADYLLYLKKYYGAEAAMFSLNESDGGWDILQSPAEHALLIKEFGAYLASKELSTKMLLGDNSDATSFSFIVPAMNDPETHKYLGAVSFHSWRGCDDENLNKWTGAARALNLPLLVAEGSTDAAAWNYPEILKEQAFAFYEINLYIKICSMCQPLSILQWQLTSDYSLLAGEGLLRTQGPLQPTRRFWNLKQLASTPPESFALPVKCSNSSVNCAAFGNIARGEYAIHAVNNGAARPAVLTGFPDNLVFDIYVTDANKGMEKVAGVKSENGSVRFEMPAASMITLLNRK